ncbi:tetratricopeptide repeat protein [Microseira sp. BLCC-F43]|jgi:tetratricopeptide (TPR) repeat protein|uniref:tetratricopeptide repeat protein n=1 Tax=Microseira sp. BLCC-F43 TaxID=3153602 RepID=UPI0035BC5CE8
MLPLFFLLIGGIALPGGAVYINQNRLRDRQWKSAVSAAGPFANMIVVLLLSLLFRVGQNWDISSWIFPSLALIVVLNIYVVLINLLPIPSLDGYGIIEPWLPPHLQRQFNQFDKYGIWFLIGLLWFVRPFNQFLWNITDTVSDFLGIPTRLAFLGERIFSLYSLYIVLVLIALLWIFRERKSELYRRGSQLISNRKYLEAIAAFDKAIQSEANYAEAWYLRGYAFLQSGKYQPALSSYDKAIEIKPDYPEAWQDKGAVLRSLHRHEEAIACYEKAIELQPYFPLAWHNRGVALHD